jgi:hypothetical protein
MSSARWAVVALLVAMAAPAAAHAQEGPAVARFGPGTAAETRARDIARGTWGGEPCGGDIAFEWVPLPIEINAIAYWANPIDPYADPSLNSRCLVRFNAILSFAWPKFCTVTVHEYGHLWAHVHSDDPNDVMAPYYRRPLPACLLASDPSAPPTKTATSIRVASSFAPTRARRLARPTRSAASCGPPGSRFALSPVAFAAVAECRVARLLFAPARG